MGPTQSHRGQAGRKQRLILSARPPKRALPSVVSLYLWSVRGLVYSTTQRGTAVIIATDLLPT